LSENTIRLARTHNKPNSEHFRISGNQSEHLNTPLTHDEIGLTIRDHGIHQEYGIVIFLDALGIKGIWKRRKPNDVVKMWGTVGGFFKHSLDQATQYLNKRPFFRMLSDTIIITIALQQQLNYSDISKTFDILLTPFIESLKTGMLFRGIVSSGWYFISDRLVIGPAIDDAAGHHDQLKWIGIAMSPTLNVPVQLTKGHSFVFYQTIPHKQLGHYGSFVLNWPNYDEHGKCHSMLQTERMQAPDNAKEKYDNTFRFYEDVTN
jgi:hypothetical protein